MRMLISVISGLFLGLSLHPGTSYANVLWQDFRISALQGNHYRLGDPERQIITVEHAAKSDWGDSFFFLDHSRSHNGSRENYAEWAPRVLWSHADKFLPTATPKLYFAGTLEMAGQATHKLAGLGTDLQIPGFKFMQLNLYRRFNEQRDDNWQSTISFALPFAAGSEQLLLDGFIDWSSGHKDQKASLNFTSQLKWLISQPLGLRIPVWAGIEYVWWRNKFGLTDSPARPADENNLNLLLKIHF